MKESAAWRHPVHKGMVILPDGHTMHANKAASQGHKIIPWPDDIARVATPHPHEADQVILPRGVATDRKRAIEAGFTVEAGTFAQNASPASSWRSAIMKLPEAQNRTSAVAEILTSQSSETMTIESARAFLRGLPTEQTEEQPTVTTNNPDPRAARKAEIANSMAAFNRNEGYGAKRLTATTSAAPSMAGIDPVKLKRLAEIRLNAVESRQAGSADEGKKLRYALQVHSQTGMPLATVFTQLGVDTSKITRA